MTWTKENIDKLKRILQDKIEKASISELQGTLEYLETLKTSPNISLKTDFVKSVKTALTQIQEGKYKKYKGKFKG